jgi:hypothetical protein
VRRRLLGERVEAGVEVHLFGGEGVCGCFPVSVFLLITLSRDVHTGWSALDWPPAGHFALDLRDARDVFGREALAGGGGAFDVVDCGEIIEGHFAFIMLAFGKYGMCVYIK